MKQAKETANTCGRCVWNNVRVCGAPYCMLPACVEHENKEENRNGKRKAAGRRAERPAGAQGK